MKISPLAGKPAGPSMLIDVPKLVTAYYTEVPDPSVPEQRVVFGTCGNRGSAFERAFNEWRILAISQAICLYRKRQHIDGPLFLGVDTRGEGELIGLLKAKVVQVFNTANTPVKRELTVYGDPLEILWKNNMFISCGVKSFYRKTFGVIITSDLEQRTKWLKEAVEITRCHFPQIHTDVIG